MASVPLELVDGFQNAKPSAKLRELIRDLGLIQPIIVVSGDSGRYQVIDGRRRAKAIALLAEDDHWPTPALVEALVVKPSRPSSRSAERTARPRPSSRSRPRPA